MPFTTLFFDLDDTLYPRNNGVWDAIAARIDLYMLERVGIPPEEIPGLRQTLFRTYGTTLRGLNITRHVDVHDYLDFVHDVPLKNFLVPDPRIRPMLQRYPQRRLIFTNADRQHAQRVLGLLDLDGCFDGVVDILDILPYCKPMPEAFEIAIQKAGAASPQECVLIDDTLNNLANARKLGLYTIRVGHEEIDGVDAGVATLADLPSVLDPLLGLRS
jgi:pyrimidine 5'-nucleotidase